MPQEGPVRQIPEALDYQSRTGAGVPAIQRLSCPRCDTRVGAVTGAGSPEEETMRYAWIGLVFLLGGCAGYVPPAVDLPATHTYD